MSGAADLESEKRLARASRFAAIAVGLGLTILLVFFVVAVVNWRDMNERYASLDEALNETIDQLTGRDGNPGEPVGNPVSARDIRMTARATDRRDSQGRRLFAYELWLDTGDDEATEIREVRYELDPVRPSVSSTRAAEGFRIRYEAPICLPTLTVVVTLRSGEQRSLPFDQCRQLGRALRAS